MMNTPWYDIAQAEIGTREVAGSKHNPRIVEYHKSTGLGASDDETPWCSSFMNWVMEQAGIPGTRSAAARSWLDWGKPVPAPYQGVVVVLKRGRSSWQGHVGLYVRETEQYVYVLGGNQGNAVNISRYPKSSVLGYRVPKEALDSKTVITAGAGAVTSAIPLVSQVTDSLTDAGLERWIPWVVVVLGVGFAAFIIHERLKNGRLQQK